MAAARAYQPFQPAKRPGGRPRSKPIYRVLVHRRYFEEYQELVDRVGETSAQQFWDHVATTPGALPRVNSTTILKGKAGAPDAPGFSRTIHYEVSGAARLNYQYSDTYRVGGSGDAHHVVRIKVIDYSSH